MGIVTLLPFVCACACCDLKTRRIPNALIWCGLAGALLTRVLTAAGLTLYPVFLPVVPGEGTWPAAAFGTGVLPEELSAGSFPSPGPGAFLFSLAGGLAGFLLPWLCFGLLAALKMIGGGDVKLLSVIGLQLGCRFCLRIIWYSLLFGAIWSAVIVIRRRNLTHRLRYLQHYVQSVLSEGKLTPYRTRTGLSPYPKAESCSDDSTLWRSFGASPADPSGEFCFAVVILAALVYVLSTIPFSYAG